jgi:hypothetical protein
VSEFELRNSKAWNACVEALVDIVYRELALKCGRSFVKPELYKLLLYEEGAFFKSHQDSEKTPGMFGTLVVALPSKHTGGNVLLKHQKCDYQFDSSKSTEFGTSLAAWYSDVFHEVEKVTGGYRLVLTYNLVQKSSSNIPRAPDGDATKDLAKELLRYNESAKGEIAGFPDFVTYSLEHKYSQQQFSIHYLKGRDFDVVDRLKNACAANNFGLYLALKEKVLHKDEDCGDEVFDREESFKYMNDLTGHAVGIIPKFNKINMLENNTGSDDDDGDEDEEPDEEEHQGWTGNEGSPIQCWYRTSMVLIVPPSRKVDFMINSEPGDYQARSKLLKEYLHSDPLSESGDYQELRKLCKLSVRKYTQPDYTGRVPSYIVTGAGEREAQYAELVALATLKMGWYDIYTSIPARFKLMSSALYSLGEYIATHTLDKGEWTHVEQLLKVEQNPNTRMKSFCTMLRGINRKNEANPSAELEEKLRPLAQWLLGSSKSWRKDSAQAFGQIALAHPPLRPIVFEVVRKCSTPTIAAFLIELCMQHESGEEEWFHEETYQQLLLHCWGPTFILEGPEIRTETTPGYHLWNRTPTVKIERDVLCSDNLDTLISLTAASGIGHECRITSVLKLAIKTVSSRYAEHELFLFVNGLWKEGELSFTRKHLQECRLSTDEIIEIAVLGLQTVIMKHVGPEPKKTNNLTLPAKGCGCHDCSVVSDFLTSPTRRQLDFPCSKAQSPSTASSSLLYRQCERLHNGHPPRQQPKCLAHH